MTDLATARRARKAVRCPHCRAAIGSPCVVPSSGRRLTMSGCHPARAEALAEVLRGGAA